MFVPSVAVTSFLGPREIGDGCAFLIVVMLLYSYNIYSVFTKMTLTKKIKKKTKNVKVTFMRLVE